MYRSELVVEPPHSAGIDESPRNVAVVEVTSASDCIFPVIAGNDHKQGGAFVLSPISSPLPH